MLRIATGFCTTRGSRRKTGMNLATKNCPARRSHAQPSPSNSQPLSRELGNPVHVWHAESVLKIQLADEALESLARGQPVQALPGPE